MQSEDSRVLNCAKEVIEELKQQNLNLVEALVKTQKSHATEKKCFNEILLGIDRALSSLPIRLEKIRVRNQRNLCLINSAGFQPDGGDAAEKQKAAFVEYTNSDDSLAFGSQDINVCSSSRMNCLLNKIEQLNDLVEKLKNDDSASPIELLVNNELYAISLLKKEISSTKKEIEEAKTDTETIRSTDAKDKGPLKEFHLKKKNSFSNELNKVSNFKIFENHMILQEEAMNLLTRKIGETEKALKREVEEKEKLLLANEALAKELLRLKSIVPTEEDEASKEIFLKTEKAKGDAARARPYRLIKDLKAKLEEQEKSLCSWKSKLSRLSAANSNKSALLDAEKRKNMELQGRVESLKNLNKSLTSQANSMQSLNQQMKDQIEILKHEVANLASELKEAQCYRPLNVTKQPSERDSQHGEEEKKELKDVKKEMKKLGTRLKKSEEKNEEFNKTFKVLLRKVYCFGVDRDLRTIRQTSYDRVREILHLTSSDFEALLNAYAKNSTDSEVQNLYKEFKFIVTEHEDSFSSILPFWIFDIIQRKLVNVSTNEFQDDN